MKDDLTHWDHFMSAIASVLDEASMHSSGLIVRPHQPSQARFEELVLRVQYVHPTMGARTDELILFRDGTWRYIPSGVHASHAAFG